MAKRTLLLADDSVTIQKVVNLTFADEGIDVVAVGDGDSAMLKISESAPDVVLADVHMPGLSGYQICEMVRQNPATRNLPVVLLVGSFEPFDESEAARVGANAYLTKPFQSIRQLVSQVTDLIQSTTTESADLAEPEIGTNEESTNDTPDTTDIDALYHQSFGEPGSEAEVEDSFHESPAEGQPAESEPEPSFERETYPDAEADLAMGAPTFVDVGMDDEMIETSHVGGPESAPENYSEIVTDSNEFEEQPPASGAFDSYANEHEAGRQEYAAAEQDSEEDFDEFADTDEFPDSESLASAASEAAPPPDFSLDELEILDLPPIDNGSSVEFTMAPRSDGGKEVVTLSPELMEILVQRVVDKLSKDK